MTALLGAGRSSGGGANALVAAQPIKRAIADLDTGRIVDATRYPRINPVAPDQHQTFQVILAGEHTIQGLRNRDLQARLYFLPAKSPTEARSRCSRVSRIITKPRGHGLLAKAPGSRLYRVTDRGHRSWDLRSASASSISHRHDGLRFSRRGQILGEKHYR